MNDLMNIKTTMTSLELVEIINGIRKNEGNVALLHKSFMTKIEKRFLVGQNILPNSSPLKYNVKEGTYTSKNNRTIKMYLLGKKECNLLVMSESEVIQEALYDRWLELENQTDETALSAYTAYIILWCGVSLNNKIGSK